MDKLNRYVIMEWEDGPYEPDGDLVYEKILLKYKSIRINNYKRPELVDVELIYPKEPKLITLIGDDWKWKGSNFVVLYPLTLDSYSFQFEAVDDDAAKLIFEAGEYEL